MKTILITGVSGFIGQNLAKKLKNEYYIIGIDIDSGAFEYCDNFYNLDITEYDKVETILVKHTPHIIIHTAAMKSLVQCEKEKEDAYKVNAEASLYLNDLSKKVLAKFIFISSDQIFHGDVPLSLTTAKKNPINYYGITKSIAENGIIKNNSAAICRTALVFGSIPKNQKSGFIALRKSSKLIVQGYIVDHVYYKLRNHEEIVLPSDEYCNPISIDLLVKQIKIIIEKDLRGIFHCCGGERISRFEFGKKIAIKFNLDSSLINPRSSEDVLRPKDVSMDIIFSQNLLGFKFPDVNEMLDLVDIYDDS